MTIGLNTFNASNLKRIRKSAGLTQKTISSEIGIGYTTYYSWESGHRAPHFDNVLKLAQFFNIDLNYFYGEDAEPPRKLQGDLSLNIVTAGDFEGKNNIEEILSKSRHYTPKLVQLRSEPLFAFEVRDRSMVSSTGNSIQPGQIAILQQTINLNPQSLNGAVVLMSENKGAAMLREINLDGMNLVIRCWNDSFQHTERSVPQKSVIIFGKLVAVLTEF